MRSLKITMTEPQAKFFQLEDKYPAFVGGFGTGKTETLANCAIRDALEAPNGVIALYEPTYDLVRLILAPRMDEKLNQMGIRFKYNKNENIIYTSSAGCADFILRTLDNPERIVGYESYRAHVDEIDTLKQEQAQLAWRKIIARNRQKPKGTADPFNRVSVYTTPEGFRFVYQTWKKDPKPGYVMIQAPTASNPFLPDDYISTLESSYPSNLIKAYLNGEFVNLVSGAVYPDFDRKLNHTSASIERGEALHVGMDFNRLKMSATVSVIRDGKPLTLSEITDARDTPQMAQLLDERFKQKGHQITIYPDASGQNSSSKNASESDFSILRAKGFHLYVDGVNPAIMDRINSVNAMILNDKGERRWLVNTDQCPSLTEALEQQVYDKNGMPDKSAGLDHVTDAQGYFIVKRFPVVTSNAQRIKLYGH